MPYFTQRPLVQELFQWTGDMDALHAWLDPKVTADQAAGIADPAFVIDTDPATGDLRFTQWEYWFYARVNNDWVGWQNGNVYIVPAAMDGNPVGMESTDLGPAPAMVDGFPSAEPVPPPPDPVDPAASTDVQSDNPPAPETPSV